MERKGTIRKRKRSKNVKKQDSHKQGWEGFWIGVSILLFCLFYFHFAEPYVAREYAYPLRYREEIRHESASRNLPFSLVAAVILTESKFDENAVSDRGAVGLMQIMPETAQWITKEMTKEFGDDLDIKNPQMNIRLGTWYLAYLMQEFKGNEVLALAAYNAGRGNVESWMETHKWGADFSAVDEIPFPETREYIKLVQERKTVYERLY